MGWQWAWRGEETDLAWTLFWDGMRSHGRDRMWRVKKRDWQKVCPEVSTLVDQMVDQMDNSNLVDSYYYNCVTVRDFKCRDNFQHNCLINNTSSLLLDPQSWSHRASTGRVSIAAWGSGIWQRCIIYRQRFLCCFHAALFSFSLQLRVWKLAGHIG